LEGGMWWRITINWGLRMFAKLNVYEVVLGNNGDSI